MAKTKTKTTAKTATGSRVQHQPKAGKRATVRAIATAGHPATLPKLAAELRAAIAQSEAAGVTRYAIAKRAGITPIMLTRIAEGLAGMKLETAEKIAGAVGLQLTLLPNRVLSKQAK